MKKSPDSREFFYRRTQARKALKGVNVVEESKAKPLGASEAPAMKSIIRRDTGESYDGYLKRLAEAEGVDAQDAAALRRMDRKRKKTASAKKKTPNEDCESQRRRSGDHEAERRAYGAGLLSGECSGHSGHGDWGHLAVTTHGGAAADTATVATTVIEAGLAAPEGSPAVHPRGVEEVVADKGYHSNEVVVGLEVRTYIAEPDRGARDWEGKQAEKEVVYGNRRRIRGKRGKRLQRQRGEKIERNGI